jgi:hypothetical protein
LNGPCSSADLPDFQVKIQSKFGDLQSFSQVLYILVCCFLCLGNLRSQIPKSPSQCQETRKIPQMIHQNTIGFQNSTNSPNPPKKTLHFIQPKNQSKLTKFSSKSCNAKKSTKFSKGMTQECFDKMLWKKFSCSLCSTCWLECCWLTGFCGVFFIRVGIVLIGVVMSGVWKAQCGGVFDFDIFNDFSDFFWNWEFRGVCRRAALKSLENRGWPSLHSPFPPQNESWIPPFTVSSRKLRITYFLFCKNRL